MLSFPEKQRDRMVLGIIAGIVIIGAVVAIWPDDEPATAGTWIYYRAGAHLRHRHPDPHGHASQRGAGLQRAPTLDK